jgi:hypothetical protein
MTACAPPMKIDSPLGPAWNKKECFESAHDFTELHIHLEWTLAAQSTFFEARFGDLYALLSSGGDRVGHQSRAGRLQCRCVKAAARGFRTAGSGGGA